MQLKNSIFRDVGGEAMSLSLKPQIEQIDVFYTIYQIYPRISHKIRFAPSDIVFCQGPLLENLIFDHLISYA